jgi:hypothetical protein
LFMGNPRTLSCRTGVSNLVVAIRRCVDMPLRVRLMKLKDHQKQATGELACHSWSFPDDGGGHYRAMSGSMNNF